MPSPFSAELVLCRLHRRRLFQSQHRYASGPSMENLADVRKALAVFSDLVVRGKKPPMVSRAHAG